MSTLVGASFAVLAGLNSRREEAAEIRQAPATAAAALLIAPAIAVARVENKGAAAGPGGEALLDALPAKWRLAADASPRAAEAANWSCGGTSFTRFPVARLREEKAEEEESGSAEVRRLGRAVGVPGGGGNDGDGIGGGDAADGGGERRATAEAGPPPRRARTTRRRRRRTRRRRNRREEDSEEEEEEERAVVVVVSETHALLVAIRILARGGGGELPVGLRTPREPIRIYPPSLGSPSLSLPRSLFFPRDGFVQHLDPPPRPASARRPSRP